MIQHILKCRPATYQNAYKVLIMAKVFAAGEDRQNAMIVNGKGGKIFDQIHFAIVVVEGQK